LIHQGLPLLTYIDVSSYGYDYHSDSKLMEFAVRIRTELYVILLPSFIIIGRCFTLTSNQLDPESMCSLASASWILGLSLDLHPVLICTLQGYFYGLLTCSRWKSKMLVRA
jgi:hypothetical protein